MCMHICAWVHTSIRAPTRKASSVPDIHVAGIAEEKSLLYPNPCEIHRNLKKEKVLKGLKLPVFFEQMTIFKF